MVFPVAQTVNNLPAMQETWVQSLGQEDSPEKEMTTHSNILACSIPWTEEPASTLSGSGEGFDEIMQEKHLATPVHGQ